MTNTQPINTFCNEGCQKEFTITKTRKIKVKDGITQTYFRCPHCKHKYVVSYVSDNTINLQKEIRKLQKSIRKLTDHSEEALDAHWKSVDELKVKVKQSMDEDRRIAESC